MFEDIILYYVRAHFALLTRQRETGWGMALVGRMHSFGQDGAIVFLTFFERYRLVEKLIYFARFFQVTGVVGRAETLSSVFFLLALLFYSHATRRRKTTSESNQLLYIYIVYVHRGVHLPLCSAHPIRCAYIVNPFNGVCKFSFRAKVFGGGFCRAKRDTSSTFCGGPPFYGISYSDMESKFSSDQKY